MINRKSIVNSPDDRLRQFNRMLIPNTHTHTPKLPMLHLYRETIHRYAQITQTQNNTVYIHLYIHILYCKQDNKQIFFFIFCSLLNETHTHTRTQPPLTTQTRNYTHTHTPPLLNSPQTLPLHHTTRIRTSPR